MCAQLYTSTGKIPGCGEIPNACKLLRVAADNGMGVMGCNKTPPMNPPATSPITKNIFHNWAFQLYLRKGIFAGIHIAQN